jgi:hypothetical protein
MPVCMGSPTGHGRGDRALTVDRTTERVDDAADHGLTDRHFEHAGRATDLIAFLQAEVVTEHDGADVVFFEVEREGRDGLAGLGGVDLEHLTGHRLHEAVDAGDAVLHFEDGTDFLDIEGVEVRRFDFAEEDVLDLTRAQRRLGSHCSEGKRGMSGGAAQELDRFLLEGRGADWV